MSEKKQNLNVPVALAFAGIIILGTILYSKNKDSVVAKDTESQEAAISSSWDENNIKNDGTHIRGNPNADILITEYSETVCPFCGRFHSTMLQIMDTYGKDGKIAWQYKHFPLDSIHPTARGEAQAAECAAELGGNDAYWKYLDTIVEGTAGKDVVKVAENIGLDSELFKTCVDNNTFADVVESHVQEGMALGIRGVPHSIFKTKDGREFAVSGAYPYEFLKLLIDMALAGKSEETINKFTDMVIQGTTPEAIEAFLAENYPEALEVLEASPEESEESEEDGEVIE